MSSWIRRCNHTYIHTGSLSLPLPAQDKFLLLRGSVQLALTHLVRVVAWDSVKGAVQQLQDRVMAAAREIMNHPHMPAVAEEQLRLPLRHGGFGLMDITELEADAAYLSSAALAHDAMRDGPPDFRPFTDGELAECLQAKWTALRAAMPPEADRGPEELDDIFIATGLPGMSRKVTRAVAQTRHDALLQQLGSTPGGAKDLARMRSCACRVASLFLDSLPTNRMLTLNDGDFVHGMRFRGGLSPLPPLDGEVICDCNARVKPGDVDHAMTCRHNADCWTLRHNIAITAWRRRVRAVGVSTSIEPVMRSLDRRYRDDSRGDILANGPGVDVYVLDVSFIHPSGVAVVGKASGEKGYAAEVREKFKLNKYKESVQGSYKVVPVVHETYGRLGSHAMQYLNTLAVSLVGPLDKRAKARWIENSLREFSAATVKGNGFVIRKTMSRVARLTGAQFVPCDRLAGSHLLASM